MPEVRAEVGDKIGIAAVKIVESDHAAGVGGVIGPECGVLFHVVGDITPDKCAGVIVLKGDKVFPSDPVLHVPATGALEAVRLAVVGNNPIRAGLNNLAIGGHMIQHQVEAESEPVPAAGLDEIFKLVKRTAGVGKIPVAGIHVEQV